MMACLIVLYTKKNLGLVKKQGNEKKKFQYTKCYLDKQQQQQQPSVLCITV